MKKISTLVSTSIIFALLLVLVPSLFVGASPVKQTVNLALNKPATASSALGANTAALAFDGNPGTRWESLQGVDPSWVQVDLGATYTISSVKLRQRYIF